MLPRVATTTGTTQPTPALLQAGASVDAAVKPQLSAAALANLRAEVLMRLIETLLKHMPHTGEPSPTRDLLETLLTVLKTLPGREGESGRKLADLIAKLPPEMRPAVEKLIGTVLSAMPTRTLIEIVRNPNGPDAQKLASLLAANLMTDDTRTGELHATQLPQQKPVALTAQQLAAVSRHGMQQAAQMAQLLAGDARTLQAVLKRIFDFDGNSKPNVTTGRSAETPGATARIETTPGIRTAGTAVKTELASNTETRATAARAEFTSPVRQSAGTQPLLHLSETRTAAAAPAPALTGEPPAMESAERATRQQGDAEEPETGTPATVRREEASAKATANATGQALARSVLQAVARDLPPALLMQAVAHLVENLSPEEATFLRALLERPLDLVVPPEGEFTSSALPSAEDTASDTVATPGQETETANADLPEEALRTRPDTTQTASIPARQATAIAEEARPAQRLAEGNLPAAQPAALPNATLPVAAALREGIPLAFVPYLPAEEDLEWPDKREAETDETGDEQEADDQNGDGEDGSEENNGDEPETPDIARRREKTAEMVGVIEPGLVYYQKLGDYWA